MFCTMSRVSGSIETRPGQRRRQSDLDCVLCANCDHRQDTSGDGRNGNHKRPSSELLKCQVEHDGISSYLVIRKPMTAGVDEFLIERGRGLVGSEMPPEEINAVMAVIGFRHALAALE